ncbi:MAG TPA: MurR/RpiR family transcriptional regulator [Bacteroidota bacterium]|nr:MurR/RpiR family transcriptional regulator [Bacteroidota bacterium]
MAKKKSGEAGQFDLVALVQSKYPSLPENQRKVADFLLHNIRDIPFLSVVEVERRSGMSKATIVRLAQSLGLSGFQELRSRLLEGVQSAIRQPDSFALLTQTDHEDTLTLVARQDVKNINETMKHLDKQTFRDIAAMILKASHVYTMGLGISSLMSKILAYSLNQVAVNATPLTHDYETFLEQLPFLSSSDLLIAFSFPPYSKETVDAATFAQRQGVPIVAITDRVTSPITFFARKVIPIRSQNLLFTNSFSAISVVINALATEVALRNKATVTRLAKELDRLMEASGYYITE